VIELIVEICLAAQPAVCASHLLPGPGPCVEARAADWVAARPGLVLADARCVPPDQAAAPLEVAEIAPGVFVHAGHQALADAANGGDIANIGFVIGTEAVAVIDAGGSRAVGEVLYRAIRARTDLPIRWLVLTHMHPDHIFGAEVYREAGAAVIGHARLPAALVNRVDSYTEALVREVGPEAAVASRIALPDVTVETTLTLDLGGRQLVLEAWPTAHTDNDLTALDTATGTWWLGDLVFDGHTPVVDGSALGWLALLDRLATRPVARVVPGHGAVALPWPEGAAATGIYLAALVAETRTALAKGESLGTATRHLGTDLGEDWLLFEAFNARNATAVYRELEWE
jgi:quinoprotein relay system zinc metallohydrolase 2